MSDPLDQPNLPESLKNDLGTLYRASIQPSVEDDRVVLNGARAHLARRGRLRLFIAAAASAAAIILVSIAFFARPSVHHQMVSVAGDVNGDGIVDIRDALLLARRLESGKVDGNDFNHDGVTDRKDVDAIAMYTVRIVAEGTAVR